MSSSNTSSEQFQYGEKDELCSSVDDIDPLSLLEEKIKELNEESEEHHLTVYKRKLSTDIGPHNLKKPKVKNDESIEHIVEATECEKENHQKTNISSVGKDENKYDSELNSEEKIKDDTTYKESNVHDDDVSKSTEKSQPLPPQQPSTATDEGTTEPESTSKEKKDKNEEKRKIQNLRKNIKEVLDDSQLDATTLAAQRQESERLARLQEAQRLIREAQRQQQAEKFANKTQQKVLSLLGESNEPINSSSAIDLDDPLFEKLSLNPAISITPASKEALQSIQSLISSDEKIPDSDDDDVIIQPEEESIDKSKAVVVDSSSDSDDCIILSDEEEEDVDEDDNNSGEHTNDLYNQPDSEGRVVVNIGHSERESDIYVAPQIARVIKPHQIGGVRFLYDNIIESIELFEKSTGFGCILAHSMGLGKTLQLVCFCDIFLRHTISKTVLIIMPINTLQNWVNEFNMWIPLPEDVEKNPLAASGEVRPREFKIYVLNDSHKSLSSRAKVVLEWKKDGGVLMMGYEMYRLLSLKKHTQKKKKKGAGIQQQSTENDVPSNEDQDFFDKIYDALVNPGPDLVVCDEGHRIKNASASTSMALKQIKSKRRVVLTGYPLQNNLLEYWCMVDFVRPNYLGSKTEFSNMFERPIQNGQCIDSTPQDCKLMRYRAHVLHSLLKGFVQRRSHVVLQKCLPQKTEYVLLVRLTPFQRKLYTIFMDEVVRSKKVPNPLKAFSVCCKIWNHPDVLYHFLKKRELDLEIELEEAENDRKNDLKKKGKKGKEVSNKTDAESKTTETTNDQASSNELNPVKLNSTKGIPSQIGEAFKPPATPLSNDSAYSSSQSISSGFENYNSYANYYDSSNPYQNYGTHYSNGSYQHWNGSATGSGSNYWQNNYYSTDYYHSNSYQSYYGHQNSMQISDTKHPMNAPSNINQINPPSSTLPPTMPTQVNNQNEILASVKSIENKHESNGGLLADVIQKEQQEKNKEDISDTIVLKNSSRDDGIPYDWAVELMKDYVPDLLENSPKMQIFFCILDESIKLGDRILVFSQSLLTLNHIERFLHRNKIPNTDTYWMKNQSYFRLDGSTAALEREKLINEFNANTNLKLFLVSTRAGSLGINLVGANRVIVFDASWNPCHDTQAVCRVYRYGQSKSCFVYRLVVDNCLEKKIYDRQINKQGMADRVIDECNPDAHLSMKEVTSLCYDDGEDPELTDFTDKQDEYEDLVIKKVLCNFSKTLTKEPFQHESLLVDRKEKKLSQAEKRLAQRGYEMEKQAATKPTYNYNTTGSNNYRLFRTPDGTLIQRPIMNNSRVAPISDYNSNPVNPAIRADNPRPNRWVPVEVWQSKGITAQEMTLPQDVSIQTNSVDRSKIFLKAGQKVIVLKSPRGICLQLESGKVIAIRASMKPGQSSGDFKTQDIPGLNDDISNKNDAAAALGLPSVNKSSSDDVIDMTNSDDEEGGVNKLLSGKTKVSNRNGSNVLNANMNNSGNESYIVNSNVSNNNSHNTNNSISNNIMNEVSFKEKPIYKPNLVQRKPKMLPPATNVVTSGDASISTLAASSSSTSTTSSMYSSDRNRTTSSSAPYGSTNYPPSHKLSWNRYQNSSTPSSSNYYRDMNGGTKTEHSMPYQSQSTPVTTTAPVTTTRSSDSRGYPSGNSSAFHAPSSIPYQNSFIQPSTPHYQSHNAYTGSTYQNTGYNYPTPPSYNYYAPHSYTSAAPRNYHYPQYGSGYDSYAGYGGNQYGASSMLAANSSYPAVTSSYVSPTSTVTAAVTTSSQSSLTTPTPSTPTAANFNQWNWNK